MNDNDQSREQRRARIVWESLERASDHLTPGHPAELHIRYALREAEAYWVALPREREELLAKEAE